MVLRILTSLNFNVFRIKWPAWWRSLLHLFSVPLLCSLHWLPARFRILLKISLFSYKTLCEEQPFYLHSMVAASLPSHHWDQTKVLVCRSLGSRPTQTQELFTLVPRPFRTTSCCLSMQPFQLLPSRNIWRHTSLTWPFSHRHRHAWWPVDVTEPFRRVCCRPLIWLSHHWAWLCRGYWRYRNLIDWLFMQSQNTWLARLPILGSTKCWYW